MADWAGCAQLKRKQELERRRALGEILSEDEEAEFEERKDKPKLLKKVFLPPKSIQLQRSPAWKVEQEEWKKVRLPRCLFRVLTLC